MKNAFIGILLIMFGFLVGYMVDRAPTAEECLSVCVEAFE